MEDVVGDLGDRILVLEAISDELEGLGFKSCADAVALAARAIRERIVITLNWSEKNLEDFLEQRTEV